MQVTQLYISLNVSQTTAIAHSFFTNFVRSPNAYLESSTILRVFRVKLPWRTAMGSFSDYSFTYLKQFLISKDIFSLVRNVLVCYVWLSPVFSVFPFFPLRFYFWAHSLYNFYLTRNLACLYSRLNKVSRRWLETFRGFFLVYCLARVNSHFSLLISCFRRSFGELRVDFSHVASFHNMSFLLNTDS